MEGNNNCIETFKPNFSRALYNTQVNVVGKHLSGLLIIKTMPDSSIRMVFANEAGFKFFDFGFKGDVFTVYYIFEQMDKKAVIKTLRKDFELILMQHINTASSYSMKKDGEFFHVFPNGSDYYYYITDSACGKLLRMERGSKRKKVVEAIAQNYTNGIPDTIGIKHSNFNFTIELKQLNDHAGE
ncbi:MAG: hypothetical protein QM802_06230 [Agriterribacter sp.]